jgi:hypothetical protein
MPDASTTKQLMCPSSKCQDGALLLGIVKEDGHVDMLHEAIPVDETFVETAKQGRLPEMRFRFASTCAKNGCKQWTGTRCGIVDKILDHVKDAILEETLPVCFIRPTCRWYNQNGADACKICPWVITETSEMIEI